MSDASYPLSGRVALVTGGGRGIGAAISRRLAELGARLLLCGRGRESLERTAGELRSHGGECELLECDVTRLESVERLAARVRQTFQRLDILVNNAGVGDFGRPLLELPPERWDDIFNTNLRGVFYCIRALAPLIIESGGGDIVNISSIASKNPLPNGAAYSASKWGLNGLSYSLAEELRARKVRVSVVCPGSTISELSPHPGRDETRMLRGSDVAHVVAMIVTQAPQSFASEIVLRPTQKP
ncbi:MAG TPA: SDR family NAD(P)-dependent oxidoreductase [Terriglobales bacterium]|nr:SDR family NAD(P)-dependent oxidoreductase [Terriglobales bacterium]